MNWKWKCCSIIVFVLLLSISYELWFVSTQGRMYIDKMYVIEHSKSPFMAKLNDVQTHLMDSKFSKRIFSVEAVSEFIVMILNNEHVMIALKTVWKKYLRNSENMFLDSKIENFDSEADIMLKDILNKRNKNTFLDVNEKYEFSVINRTCKSIEKNLSRKGQCILSLEGTLCSELKTLSSVTGNSKKHKKKPRRKEGREQNSAACDYMHMNSTSFSLLPQKNPCYEECDGGYNTIRCLPYFLIIGMPRSGTTSLYHHLTHHKDVVPGKAKEPMYFNRNCYRGMNFADYSSNFDEMKTHIGTEMKFTPFITGDASADLAFDSWNWRNFPGNEGLQDPKHVIPFYIHKLLPKLKIIVILRDPVERLYSDYLYEAPSARYLLSLEDFHQAVHRAISKHKQCQLQFSIRTCAYNSSLENYKARLRVGMYHVFLTDWMQIFSRDQFLVINFDDYTRDKKETLIKVSQFLELSDLTSEESKVFFANHAKENGRSNRTRAMGDMLAETKEMLREFYKPFNVNLSQLLQSDRFLWSYSGKE